MVCAACRHVALVFAVMHLHNFEIIIASVHSFFILLKNNLVLINRRSGPRYQRVLALGAFLIGAILKGLILRKKMCLMFVYFLFYVGLCQD